MGVDSDTVDAGFKWVGRAAFLFAMLLIGGGALLGYLVAGC